MFEFPVFRKMQEEKRETLPLVFQVTHGLRGSAGNRRESTAMETDEES